MKQYPTLWQKKILWTAATFIGLAAIVILFLGSIYHISQTIAYLQPLLLPFAIASVLFYLLEPVVAKLCDYKFPRFWAVLTVFAAIFLAIALFFAWFIPTINHQARNVKSHFPDYLKRAEGTIQKALDFYERNFMKPAAASLPPDVESDKPAGVAPPEVVAATPTQTPTPSESPTSTPAASATDSSPTFTALIDLNEDGLDIADVRAWATDQIPVLTQLVPGWVARGWNMVSKSMGGFLGAFGFILNLVIVPVYLFFLLLEGPKISQRWSDYLPLRASALKTELVSLLTEINGYLIAFFRGQVLVSVIDGLLTGIALMVMGLQFGFAIGLLLAILGVIPYLGIVICWIPAVLIAAAQWGDWQHVLVVTIIFVVIQQLDGIFIAPRIVGESVGLHPLTVIMSVFGWSVLLGGLLGAILAVPLTATLKVILKRYVWDRPPMDSDPPPDDPPPEQPRRRRRRRPLPA